MTLRPDNLSAEYQNRRLVKSTFAVAFPTLISRIFGYLRDMLQAFYMGTGRGNDAFTMAFIIPNLLRRLTGEGAMTAAFVPVFTQLKKDEKKAELWRFANAFFFDLTVLMAGLTVLGILLAPLLVRVIAPRFAEIPGKLELTASLTQLMFPYIFLISMAALAMAILNSFHKFFVPAFTPVLFNLSIITVSLLLARKAAEPAYVFAAGVLIGGVCQLAFQLPFLWRQGMRFRFGLSFTHPAVRKVGRLMVPGILGVGIYQVNFAISRWIAHLLEEGSVSALYYASRVEELTLGLFSIALSIALLPTLSDLAAHRDIPGMKRTMGFSLKLISLVTLPAMVGLVVLSRPIIQVLFQRGVFGVQSTDMTSSCLFFFAFGLPFISGVKILAPAFYSLKDTKTPVYVAFFVMIVYISLSFALMGSLRVGGIALALSLASVVNFLVLFYLLEQKIGPIPKRKLLISILKTGLAAAGMGAALRLAMAAVSFQELRFAAQFSLLLALVLGGIGVYTVLQKLFNPEDLKGLRKMFSRQDILKNRGRR